MLANWSPSEDPNLAEALGFVLQVHIGGKQLHDVSPDVGRTYPPGSYGAERATRGRHVTVAEFFKIIRGRLLEIVDSGLLEHTLVRAVADELDRWVEGLAKVGEGNERREELRESLIAWQSDPVMWDRLRTSWAEMQQDEDVLTDDDVIEQLKSMAESTMLDPTPPEEAERRRLALGHWSERRERSFRATTSTSGSRSSSVVRLTVGIGDNMPRAPDLRRNSVVAYCRPGPRVEAPVAGGNTPNPEAPRHTTTWG